MRKAVWLTLLIALVIVNGLAMLAEAYSGLVIPLPYRLVIVFAITLVSLIFTGAWQLMRGAESEQATPGELETDASQQTPQQDNG